MYYEPIFDCCGNILYAAALAVSLYKIVFLFWNGRDY